MLIVLERTETEEEEDAVWEVLRRKGRSYVLLGFFCGMMEEGRGNRHREDEFDARDLL